MIRFIVIFMLMMLPSAPPMTGPGHAHPTRDIQSYVLDKLAGHDLVFMGTTHRQPPILGFMARLAPRLHDTGVTHLALEIASDQQAHLDHFMATGTGMESIALHGAIDCSAYRRLLTILQRLDPDHRPHVIAIDLPAGSYEGAISRDEHMALALAATLRSHPKAKILSMLGSLHVLRKLPWQSRLDRRHSAIRTYLSQWRPDLKLFSMVHIIGDSADSSDFSRRLGPLPGMVALDIGPGFNGWRLGVTACLALRPVQPCELVDGVIVH